MTSALNTDERERLQAQNTELATLAGGLAHEIRNPLSTIRMNLELLAEDLEEEDSARARRMLDRIGKLQNECLSLEDVLNEFLQFAKAGQLDLQECSLNDEVDAFLAFLTRQAEEQGVELRPHLDANLSPVRIDRALIRQVLSNLARNALQAMSEGGTLEFLTMARDNGIALQVIDTGEGMDEKTVSKMFQAFFSTRSGGSGLGLPTVRRIIEAHGGTIACESEPGRGTRFTILLPTTVAS
jgi:two-component system, NtrC family, sensor histidine kinase HydH